MTSQNREYFLELSKIVSTTLILVVDQKGNLKRLYVPFRFIAIVEMSPQITLGAFYMVEAITMTLDLKEVFIIKSKAFMDGYLDGFFMCAEN